MIPTKVNKNSLCLLLLKHQGASLTLSSQQQWRMLTHSPWVIPKYPQSSRCLGSMPSQGFMGGTNTQKKRAQKQAIKAKLEHRGVQGSQGQIRSVQTWSGTNGEKKPLIIALIDVFFSFSATSILENTNYPLQLNSLPLNIVGSYTKHTIRI